MTTKGSCLELAPQSLAESLRTDAVERAQTAEGELVLDFAAIPRVDAAAVEALGSLADTADARAIRLVLRNVNAHLYKTLKLLKMVRRFTFLS